MRLKLGGLAVGLVLGALALAQGTLDIAVEGRRPSWPRAGR